MSFESIEEIIQFAIDKEKEAADFYESVAKEESLSGLKEMLLEFAGEERKHQAMLEGFQKEGVAKEVAEAASLFIASSLSGIVVIEAKQPGNIFLSDSNAGVKNGDDSI